MAKLGPGRKLGPPLPSESSLYRIAPDLRDRLRYQTFYCTYQYQPRTAREKQQSEHRLIDAVARPRLLPAVFPPVVELASVIWYGTPDAASRSLLCLYIAHISHLYVTFRRAFQFPANKSAWHFASNFKCKVKVKVHTLDIAPLRSESPPQCALDPLTHGLSIIAQMYAHAEEKRLRYITLCRH